MIRSSTLRAAGLRWILFSALCFSSVVNTFATPLDPPALACEAEAGALSPLEADCIIDSLELKATSAIDPVVPEGFVQAYVLTTGSDLTIIGVNDEPQFTITQKGDYRIHSLVFDPHTLDLEIVEFGQTTALQVLALLEQGGGDICASLDILGAAFHIATCPCEADAGTLKPISEECVNGQRFLVAEEDQAPTVPDGFQVLYVLTSGDELLIQGVSETPEFTVDTTGQFTIHTLVFDPATLDLGIVEFGVTTGFDVNGLLIQGGGDICASLLVAGAEFHVDECPCEADAGTLKPVSEECVNGQRFLVAEEDQAPTVPDGFQVLYVLTSGDELLIQGVSETPEFTVDTTGQFTIHTLVFDPATLDLGIVEFGVTTGFDVNGLLIQGGGDICASLLVAGAEFHVDECPCVAEAGTLNAAGICIEGSLAQIFASPAGNAVVPHDFELIYVLTSGDELVIEAVNEKPEFIVQADRQYRIHTLVYDPETLDLNTIEFGVTTGFDVNGLLIQGGGEICGALDVAGVQFNFGSCDACLAAAGMLAPDSESCLQDSALLTATPSEAPNIPSGFELIYVLTSGDGLVIQDVNISPEFTVTDTGLFTIHTLVYDPNTLDLGVVVPGVTTGFDVNNLLIQGGGEICGALLIEGAVYQVEPCCQTEAGTLEAVTDNCLDGAAELEATEGIAPVIPAGFELIYVLTSGPELVIQDVSNVPVFTVTDTGLFTIHTLVYDPTTLDLTIVEPGVTTGFDVNALLFQGGGSICGSLLVAGAQFHVNPCPCIAEPGTLKADSDNCLDGIARLEAVEDIPPVVPDGYDLLYVLTSGPELLVQDVDTLPAFSVTDTGLFTIHTLVFNPLTFNLRTVEPGNTTGFDVNALLLQGGGEICGSLLVAGAQFQVDACPCSADAGTLKPESDNCLDGESIELIASENDPPVVPEGYEKLFVLTSGTGLVIEAVSSDPLFEVDSAGLFTIHTLVYNPLTLDLSIVEFGLTTGFDVNALLLQGGGTICGALDIAGTSFFVAPCNDLQWENPFPNPATSELTIPIPAEFQGTDLLIRMTDNTGKIVLEQLVNMANRVERLGVGDLASGKFYLTIFKADGELSLARPIIKM